MRDHPAAGLPCGVRHTVWPRSAVATGRLCVLRLASPLEWCDDISKATACCKTLSMALFVPPTKTAPQFSRRSCACSEGVAARCSGPAAQHVERNGRWLLRGAHDLRRCRSCAARLAHDRLLSSPPRQGLWLFDAALLQRMPSATRIAATKPADCARLIAPLRHRPRSSMSPTSNASYSQSRSVR